MNIVEIIVIIILNNTEISVVVTNIIIHKFAS